MAFPSTARDGQTHNEFGKKYVYSEISGTWAPAVPLASLSEIRLVEQAAQTATASYATAAELPLSGNTSGKMAFVQETNRLYIWSGTGWYNVATITSAAASISGANSSYNLATDGTPTVITLNQSGLTSPTWSYSITSGAIGKTAVITQADNVFTITPSTQARNIGSFGVTFKATDGSNTIVTSSQFTMSNTAPVIDTGPSATYTLAKDGTPTIITLAATDADGHAITWSYEVVSGSLGNTTVTNVGPVFTITPSTNISDAGVFQLRFVASDGASSDTDVAEFTLGFGPSYSYTIDSLSQTGTSFLDWFGYSIAANNTSGKLVIGAPEDGVGAALVYNGSDGSLLHTLTPPDPATTDRFGQSVSISDSFVLVGSPREDLNSDADTGRAHLYNASTGALLTSWDNPNNYGSASVDYFGFSVAVSENYAAVTAIGENNAANRDYAGVVYVYSTTSPYTLLYTLNRDLPYYDSFGWSLKISGNYLFVGAPKSYDAAYGRLFIYDLTTGNEVTIINPGSIGNWGSTIDVSGNYLVVADASYDYGRGRLWVYTTASGNWSDVSLVRTTTYPRTDPAATYDAFPSQVAVNGTYYIGTAPDMEAGALEAGKPKGGVFVFDLATGNLVSTLYRPDNVNGVTFGKGPIVSMTISGESYKTVAMTEDKLWVSDSQAVVGTHTQAGKVFAWDL